MCQSTAILNFYFSGTGVSQWVRAGWVGKLFWHFGTAGWLGVNAKCALQRREGERLAIILSTFFVNDCPFVRKVLSFT